MTSTPMSSPSARTEDNDNLQGMNSGASRPPPRRIILNMSSKDVQLQTSKNAWKPGLRKQGPAADPEVQNTEELLRKFRRILNKMTPEKFDRLMKQVTDLEINTEERLKGVVDLIFEKAIAEPNFAETYGKMCCCLGTLNVPRKDDPNGTVEFCSLLLTRCGEEFQKDQEGDLEFERQQNELASAASSTERKWVQKELEDAQAKARRRSIGNIKFVGELFRLNMLSEGIMFNWLEKLLKNPDDESLECLCKLLTTIGKDIDCEKAKPQMDHYYNEIETIIKGEKTSSRIRFLLKDAIDLRTLIELNSSSPAAAPTKTMFPEELSCQLDRLLLDDTSSDQQVFDWVEANLDEGQRRSPSFLRALMTAVCRSAVIAFDDNHFLDPGLMDRRRPVLLEYLDSDTERQLQALYALQALDVALGHPPYLLQFFCDWLADKGVISDAAFYKWQRSKDPEEHEGRDVALKSLGAFFMCLQSLH